MALILPDRVKVRSHSTGTGTFTLENPVEGFRGFSAVGDGNETYYGIVDYLGNWEIGRGTWISSSNTLSRDTTISSSNNGAKINFAAGGKIVYATFPSSLAQEIYSTTSSDSFSTISIAGQNDIIADSSTDTLTIVAGNNISLTTNSLTDTLTIDAADQNLNTTDMVEFVGVTTSYVASENAIEVLTSAGTDNYSWTFNNNGSLTFPDGTIQSTAFLGGTVAELNDDANGNKLLISPTGDLILTDVDGSLIDNSGGGVDRGIVWDFGTFNGGTDSYIRQSDGGLWIHPFTTSSGNPAGQGALNILTGDPEGAFYTWNFDSNGALTFPDGSVQTTAFGAAEGTFSTLPDFLDFYQGTSLRVGQNSQGIFFSGDAGSGNVSYPIRTNFAIPGTTKVTVTLDMVVNDVNEFCSDFGLCVFQENTTPRWKWAPNETRLAAQYDCPNPTIEGTTGGNQSGYGLPGAGTYRVRFTYDPNNSPNLKLETLDTSDNVLDTVEYDETLDTGRDYYIGFAADQDITELRTYIKNLTISVDGGATYYNSLIPTFSATTTTNSNDADGTLWFNTDEGRLYIKYNGQYVDASPVIVPLPPRDLEVDTIEFSDGTVVSAENGLLTLAGDLLVGTLWAGQPMPYGDKESVLWATEDSEYVALWWGGNRTYPTDGYGPKASIHAGNEGGDDMAVVDPIREPNVGVYVNVGPDRQWFFGPDGALNVPGAITNDSGQDMSILTDGYDFTIDAGGGNYATVNSNGDVYATGTITANSSLKGTDLQLVNGDITLSAGSPSSQITISPSVEGQAFVSVPDDASANSFATRVVNNSGDVKIEVSGPNIWTFSENGIVFPDSTTQQTAYTRELTTFFINAGTTSTTGLLGGDTILIKPDVGYAGSDAQGLGFTGRNVVGMRTLLINGSSSIVTFDLGNSSEFIVNPITVMEVICVDSSEWYIISERAI